MGKTTMQFIPLAVVLLLNSVWFLSAKAYDCQGLLQDKEITNTDWESLEPCLGVANSEEISPNTSENVWRLIKIVFDGVENVPAEVYGKIRLVLTIINVEELHNISMSRVEIVEAFGGVHALNSDMHHGFSDAQMKVIASKVRNEWLGKEPETYSEYDLLSMGNIVCHLNESDIKNIHADAFKAAIEWIGSIETCPEAQLQAFAKLAMQKEAFGEANEWSKIVISLIGNIINGLSQSELATIDENKLKLNPFYIQKHRKNGKKARSGQNVQNRNAQGPNSVENTATAQNSSNTSSN